MLRSFAADTAASMAVMFGDNATEALLTEFASR
jgi:hypothetical protein